MEKKVLHYELVEQLGSGGAGDVYKAIDTRLGRPVALKFINHTHGASKRIGDMLISEARTASRLDHANIGTIFEIGRTDDERPFIAMAYYEGNTLQHLIRSGPLPIDQATGYARQMAEGLAYAHAHDVVHRDIKPSNVIVTVGGVLKIIDFGLARATQDPEVTMTLGMQGTPAYMSPEQATGLPADHRSDQWAWGLVFYEMLTGTQPFTAQNLQATLYAVIHKPFEPVTALRPEVPLAWAAMVSAALERDPARRLPSMAEALRQCHEALHSPDVVVSSASAPSPSNSPLPQPVGSKPATDSFRHRVGLETLASGAHTSHSVAVMRLKNLTGGEEGEIFSEGLSEELINSLAKLSNIRVLARTSSFQFKDTQVDPKEIHAKLGATHMIDGSIRKQGNRVRILVRLTNTELETVEWSERYDRLYEDVFAIQDEVGAAVAHVLHVALNESGGRGARIRTTVPEALDLYLKGRYQLNRSNPVELGNAVRSFEEATRLDPTFALAFSNLADAYLVAAHWSVIPMHDARVRAKAAAQRALELDPDLAEAHSSMAAVSLAEDWSNFPQAAKGFEKAIALNPSYAPAYFWYGQLILRPLGQIQKALAAAKCAVDLDPLSPAMRVASAYTYYYAGDFDRAIKEAQSSLDVDPNYIEAAYLQGMAHIAAGNPGKAVALMTDSIARFGPRPWQLSELGVAEARLGHMTEARAIAEQIEAGGISQTVAPMAAGYIYIAMRDFDNANRCLERAYEMKDYRLLSLIGNPSFPEVFTLPEFERHARRLREISQTSLNQTHLSGLSMGEPHR